MTLFRISKANESIWKVTVAGISHLAQALAIISAVETGRRVYYRIFAGNRNGLCGTQKRSFHFLREKLDLRSEWIASRLGIKIRSRTKLIFMTPLRFLEFTDLMKRCLRCTVNGTRGRSRERCGALMHRCRRDNSESFSVSRIFSSTFQRVSVWPWSVHRRFHEDSRKS